MPVIKVECPKCETRLRFTVEDEETQEVECPKCGHLFSAEIGEDKPLTKSDKAKKSSKADQEGKASSKKSKARRRDDDEDDDDETPRKRRRDDAADSSNMKVIIIGGLAAGVLLLGGLGALIFALSGKDDKNAPKDNSPVAEVKQPQLPGNQPGNQTPPVGLTTNLTPAPGTGTGTGTATGTGKPPIPGVGTGTATGPSPGAGTGPSPGTGTKPKDETELSTLVPPPPKIRISGSLVPESKPIVKPPAIPPLAPDEDPFVRAANFKLDGKLPTLPPLVDRKMRPVLTLDANGHTDIIRHVFFTPNGDRIITVAKDKAVRIWNPATNETLKTIRFPAGPGKEGLLQAAAISRNGKSLAVAGHPVGILAKGKGVPIYIISPDTGAMIKRLDVALDAVRSLHFSNDGKWLAIGCENGALQIVDVVKNIKYGAVSLPGNPEVMQVRFNPDPTTKILATLGDNNIAQIWAFTNQGAKQVTVEVLKATPVALAWSNDGRTLAIGTLQGEILLNTKEGKWIKTLPRIGDGGKPVSIRRIQFLPGDNEIAVSGGGGPSTGWAGIINADTGAVRMAFREHTNIVNALDVSPDGKQIVTSGGNQNETYIWSVDTGKVLNRFLGTGKGVWAIAWAKDGKSLAWGNSNSPDENGNRKLEFTFRLDEFGIGDPPDPSKYVQRVESDEHVKLLVKARSFLVQTTGRDPVIVPPPPGELLYDATVLPKGNAVIVAATQSLRMLNPATLREIRGFVGHASNITCVTPSPDGKLFATGSSDQTIRIWQRDQEEPLLSIFVSGHDWIAWTPQGYYACSGQGERLVAWQVNAGANKVPLVHPAEQFRASMYQPALLKYIVPAGDLAMAMAMAQKYDKALVQTTSVADVVPPEVTLEGFGESEVKLDGDKVVVKATATSAKHPITAMRLLVNGRPFKGSAGVQRFANAQNTAEASWEVPLPPGTHTFAVIADSAVSKGMSKVGIGVRPGEPPKPNLYVLAMGVSVYPPGVNQLHYCASDAEMLAKAFQEKSKTVFNRIEVKVLTNKGASKKGMLEGLDWLKSKMTSQDVGIVSFSGHGTKDPFGQFYLCPSDMDPKDEDHVTFLSGKLFKDRLDEMPGRLVAILDACHSGVVAEKGPPAADTLVRDLTAADSGVIVMCASAGREYATESRLTKAGFYTLGLVEGLSGYGDVDGDGVVYIHELDLYATIRVKQLSGGRQNPTLGRPQTVRPFPIAKVEKPIEP